MFILEESIKACKECIELLLDNQFNQAVELSGQHADHSLYHSHGHSLLLWFKAYLSLEMPEIEKAQAASEKTLELCESVRPQTMRDNFFFKLFLKTNYEDFTDDEIHAELIRAEQIVFSTVMEFFIDQSLFVLVKVSYRLRTCYLMYKSFAKILDTKQWHSQESFDEFESAVKLGLGLYNLMFSLLPEKVMGLLSIVGYKGSREEGIKMLNESAFSKTLRSFPSQMVVGSYECYLDQVFNVRTTKAPAMEKHIEAGLSINSQCIWFLVFKGRLHLIKRDVEGALKAFQASLELTIDVKQLTNLYVWEIMWCQAILGNWSKAHEYSRQLRDNCPWSLPTFYYMEAIFLYMDFEKRLIGDDPNFVQSKECNQMRQQITSLLNEVPKHVKRYAGRRIPVEKYVCEKVEKFNEEGMFVAPAYELFLAYNLFIFIEGQKDLIEPMLSHVDLCLQKYKLDQLSESYMLLCLLKAACLRFLGRYDEAEPELFKIVTKLDEIKFDKHLGPMATLELAIVKMGQKHYGEARHWLVRTKSDFPSYALELMVQLRVHKASLLLRKLQNLAK